MLDAADVVDLQPRPGRPPTRSTRTSGSTRCGWPASPTRSPTELAEVDPDHAPTTPRNAGRRCGTTSTALDADVRRRAGRLRARHHRGQPRRVRLPRQRYGLDVEAINGLSPDAEPTPADLARLQHLIGTRASPRCSPRRWSARSSPRPWPATWASAPRCSTRSRASATRPRTRTTCRLMRANLAALQEANRC